MRELFDDLQNATELRTLAVRVGSQQRSGTSVWDLVKLGNLFSRRRQVSWGRAAVRHGRI